MNKEARPSFSIPISSDEKSMAEKLRAQFAEVIEALSVVDRYVTVFSEHIDHLEADADLSKMRPLIRRYGVRLKERFNEFIELLESALKEFTVGFDDRQLSNIKYMIIENVRLLRENVIEVLKFFNYVEDPDFITNCQNRFETLHKYIDNFNTLVRNQLFEHLDYNILGRIRLGVFEAPITLRG